MRQIKFRAWDKKGKRFWSQKEMTEIGGFYYTHGVDPDPEEYALMQYTGLHDKNGKEIYEGDICQIWNVKGDKIVENYTGYAEMVEGCWHLVRNGERTTIFSFAIYCKRGSKQGIEIIGNRFEHPELLNK